MSTTRLTFGSILATVQTTAATVTSTLEAANSGVGMLSSYITEAAENQRIRQIADKEDFLENLIQERAEQRAVSAIRVETFCKKSAEHAKHYGDAYIAFTNLLRPTSEG